MIRNASNNQNIFHYLGALLIMEMYLNNQEIVMGRLSIASSSLPPIIIRFLIVLEKNEVKFVWIDHLFNP